MNISGWIFMGLSVLVITALTVFSFWKILTKK